MKLWRVFKVTPCTRILEQSVKRTFLTWRLLRLTAVLGWPCCGTPAARSARNLCHQGFARTRRWYLRANRDVCKLVARMEAARPLGPSWPCRFQGFRLVEVEIRRALQNGTPLQHQGHVAENSIGPVIKVPAAQSLLHRRLHNKP